MEWDTISKSGMTYSRETMSQKPSIFRELNRQIRTCRRCRLWEGTLNAVPGEGPASARLMLIGQNPGKEEDKTGRPFVGRSGQYLNRVLAANGFRREDIFITALVKHGSPRNRKPRTDEIVACMPYTVEQIKLIRPAVIILMGEVAWKTPRIEGIRYIEIYHPAAAMRFPKVKVKFEEDLRQLKTLFNVDESQGT
jgi:uracil-DNA glycosylase